MVYYNNITDLDEKLEAAKENLEAVEQAIDSFVPEGTLIPADCDDGFIEAPSEKEQEDNPEYDEELEKALKYWRDEVSHLEKEVKNEH